VVWRDKVIHPGRTNDFKGFHVSKVSATMHGIGRNDPDAPHLDQPKGVLAGHHPGFRFLDENILFILIIMAGDNSVCVTHPFPVNQYTLR
jgi:hypothetical protein